MVESWNENELESALLAFAIRTTGTDRIDKSTEFFGDVGIDGLDALEFIQMFSDEFKVDISKYNPNLYQVEGVPFSKLIKFGFRRLVKREKFGQFNLDHLKQVAMKGVWFDPDSD